LLDLMDIRSTTQDLSLLEALAIVIDNRSARRDELAYSSPAPDLLVYPDPLARPEGIFHRAVAQERAQACGPRRRSAEAAEEPKGGDRRCAGPTAIDVQWRS
jgi:hypothetical protein